MRMFRTILTVREEDCAERRLTPMMHRSCVVALRNKRITGHGMAKTSERGDEETRKSGRRVFQIGGIGDDEKVEVEVEVDVDDRVVKVTSWDWSEWNCVAKKGRDRPWL